MGLLGVGADLCIVSRGAARVLQSPEIRHRVGATETCRGKPQGSCSSFQGFSDAVSC
jgi:hypothetical protein